MTQPLQTFIRKFITILVLFSVSGMGIFGSMQEGITGNPTILIARPFSTCLRR